MFTLHNGSCPEEYRLKYSRFLAQTTDPDDFIREGMFDWMRRYEQMVDEFVTGIIVASEEFVAHAEQQDLKAIYNRIAISW